MRRPQHLQNRFGLLLIVLGIVFSLSCWLYYLATVRSLEIAAGRQPVEASRLMVFFRDQGVWLLGVELICLAACVLAVILADRQGQC